MADIKLAYGTAVTGSGGLTSLGTSATWVAGFEWFICDNTAGTPTNPTDRLIQGVIRVGTTPTINTEIRVYAVGSYDGTTWPDVFDGTASAETVTSEGVRDGFAKLAAVLRVDSTTTARDYPFLFTLASLFGGSMPKKIAIFVAHNTGVALNATAGQHLYYDQPIFATST